MWAWGAASYFMIYYRLKVEIFIRGTDEMMKSGGLHNLDRIHQKICALHRIRRTLGRRLSRWEEGQIVYNYGVCADSEQLQ